MIRPTVSCLVLLPLLGDVSSGKVPPPATTSPVCHREDKADCEGKVIRTKVYIEDTLWDKTDKEQSGIGWQLDQVFQLINSHLQNLDNGGFRVKFLASDVKKLSMSEIVLEDTYMDKMNNNKATKANNANIHSYAFTLQKAVQKLENRHSVDLRILFIPDRGGQTSQTYGATE